MCSRKRALLVAAFTCLGACEGTISEVEMGPPPLRLPPPEERPPEVVLDPTSCELPETPSEVFRGPLRLLTRDEFEATLSMILEEEVRVRDMLLPDLALSGESHFLSNRGRSVEDQDLASFRIVAEHVAGIVAANLDGFLLCDAAAADRACVRDSLQRLMRLAYRRAPTDAEVDALMRVYDIPGDVPAGIELAAGALFQSPNFIYHVEVGTDGVALTDFEFAARMAFFITGRGPSAALLDAAEAGVLASASDQERLARELFHSPEGRAHTIEQLTRWIGIETIRSKVPSAFPGVDVSPEALDQMRRSMQDDLEARVFESPSGVGDWFIDEVEDRDAAGYDLDTAETPRAGLLTHPAWLTAFSGGDGNIPTSRGKFVATDLLCLNLVLPDDVVIPDVMEDDGSRTTRERFEAHGDMPCAAACHTLMDPIGYAFENFDAVGRFQTTENDLPIDASGRLRIPTLGIDAEFDNARELSRVIGESDAIKACFSQRWFEQATARPAQHDEGCAIARLSQPALEAGATLEDITVAIVTSAEFQRRTPNRDGEGRCQ